MHGGHSGGPHGGGLTGLGGSCGFGPAGMFGGIHGVASIAFGMNASIDFIGGVPNTPPDNSSIARYDQSDARSIPDKDVVVLNIRHGEVDLLDLFTYAMNQAGFVLVKAPFNITGQRPLLDTGWQEGIVPVTAWAGMVSGPGSGPMPSDVGQQGGKHRMFRLFFQVVERKWWFSIYEPQHEPDQSAHCYLDVAGMVWYSNEFGDYQSQLLIRLISSKEHEPILDEYLINEPAVKLHRKAEWLAARKVNEMVRAHKPSQASEQARRLQSQTTAEAIPANDSADTSGTAPGAASVRSGVDLRSALGGGSRGTASQPATSVNPQPETVVVKVSLPGRTS